MAVGMWRACQIVTCLFMLRASSMGKALLSSIKDMPAKETKETMFFRIS